MQPFQLYFQMASPFYVCQEKRSTTWVAYSLHLIFIIQCIYVRKFVVPMADRTINLSENN